MCGIVAASAASNIVPVLVEGLKKLEYRGYDSAGIAVISGNGIERVRSVGQPREADGARGGSDAIQAAAEGDALLIGGEAEPGLGERP